MSTTTVSDYWLVETSEHTRKVRVPCRAEDGDVIYRGQALAIAAGKAAVKRAGIPGGRVVSMRLDSWAENGSVHRYEAFVGTPSKEDPRSYSGRNVQVSVYGIERRSAR